MQAIGIEVEDAQEAYEQCINNGGVGVQLPSYVEDENKRGGVVISEVHAYGDVVLRFISFVMHTGTEGDGAGVTAKEGKAFSGTFLPNFHDVEAGAAVVERGNFGLQRADHIVGNVWDMLESVSYD